MLKKIIAPLEKNFDSVKLVVKKKLNLFDPIFIYPYRSYGFKDEVILIGRVLEKERVVHKQETKDSLLRNLYRFFKRYESDEIPGVKLEVKYGGETYHTTTDDEGYYHLKIPAKKNEDQPFWDKVHFKIIDTPADLEGDFTATGEIMFPNEGSEFGVISDVDDTILDSNATNFLLKVKTLAFNNARARIAFPGVAALYRGLIAKNGSKYKNPLWFISGSSWNIYDMLNRFCEEKNIPKAPFLLRQLDIDAKKIIKKDAIPYKLGHLRPLMKFTDPLPFILIGDSGQKDPEIYKTIAEEFPGRVKAIYIRGLTPNISDERDKEIKKMAKELKKKNIDMILADNSLEAAKHANKNNWISEESLREVQDEVKNDTKQE
ncbi:MAG: App1 family protein [Candidatus Cyclobacteriaceae bacterium M2_1C_046]